MAGSDTGAKAKGAKRPVFRDLPGLRLCADTPKRTGVARIEESAGPEPQGVGRVDLWRHLLRKCSWPNAMRHDSDRFLNVNESARGVRQPGPGALGNLVH